MAKRSQQTSQAAAAAPGTGETPALAAFVAVDPISQSLLQQVRRIATSDSTVLLQGESGTGKDLLASLIHYLGPHPEEPLVKIDCAGIPFELLESELFGFERGAFTGARESKRGRMELAGQGTLVLDEIAALGLSMQSKLLRVLEERVFYRLGGSRPLRVNARIIAITNLPLQDAVTRGAFREDLYFRLNVLPLTVPPLRQRRADVRPLALHLLAKLAQAHRRSAELAADALQALEQYDFPGNVRELRNVLERALVNAPGPSIRAEDLPVHVRTSSAVARKPTLEELEKNYIAEVLDYTRGRKSKAAEILGISRKTLLEKRRRYGL